METKTQHEKIAIYYNEWCKSNKPNNYSEARNSVDFADDCVTKETTQLRDENKRLREQAATAIEQLYYSAYAAVSHVGIANYASREQEAKRFIKTAYEEAEQLLKEKQ